MEKAFDRMCKVKGFSKTNSKQVQEEYMDRAFRIKIDTNEKKRGVKVTEDNIANAEKLGSTQKRHRL